MSESAPPSRFPDETIPRWPWWKTAILVFGIWTFAAVMMHQFSEWGRPAPDATMEEHVRAFLASLFASYSWAVATFAILAWQRLFPMLRGRVIRSLVLHIVFSIGLLLVLALVITVGGSLIRSPDEANGAEMFRQWLHTIPTELFFGSFTYWFIVAIGTAIDTARRLRIRSERMLRLEGQLHQARLEALRAQLHPHFLFNTLNAIASLVRQGRSEEGVEMIARLSDLLRRVLRHDGGQMIPLAEEIDLIEQYLSIEEVRFGDRLAVEIDIDPAVDEALVPAMILQPLVENAIRHGVERNRDRGAVRIIATPSHAGGVSITIENDGPEVLPHDLTTSEGVGLSNARDRLVEMFGAGSQFDISPRTAGGVLVEINIPRTRHMESSDE